MLCDHPAHTTGCFWDLPVSKCLCMSMPICLCVCVCEHVFKAFHTLFLCSAPEIEASPADEPELSSGFWVVWAADKQRLTYFPDCGRRSLRSCSSLLCYWDNKGALISYCCGSLCREGMGWCNAVCAALAHAYWMHYGRKRPRNQCNKSTSVMILRGIVILSKAGLL